MPYPRRFLNDYETVALDLHPHWWYFWRPVALLIGSIVGGILSIIFLRDIDRVGTVVNWLAVISLVISIGWLGIRYAGWRTTYFVITSDRIIYKSGLLHKSGIEIPLERVNNVLFHQTIWEQMIGAGDLLMESGGERGQQQFTDVRNPQRVQNLIHSQMEMNESRRFMHPDDRNAERAGTPSSKAAEADVSIQLERLEAMMERGNLTRTEFEHQKRRLLGLDEA